MYIRLYKHAQLHETWEMRPCRGIRRDFRKVPINGPTSNYVYIEVIHWFLITLTALLHRDISNEKNVNKGNLTYL